MTTSRRDNRQEQELRAIIDDIPGNDKCADCEAGSPRWASYSLGVFLCTRCASIHRKNSDISKVKSISLDTWTPDQVQKMREVGNTISNYKFNPLREWPLQDDDQTMERFIRDKYERHMFMSQRETANFTPVKSAMKGSAKPIESGKSSSAVIKYSKELDQLREMGFTDRSKNLDVLKQVMGDVTSATDVLVSMASEGPQAAPKKPEKLRVRFTADTIGGEEQTPQIQAANPFDMWAQAGSSQQGFQNPFSSIPPSMYNNQNFVHNVQAQGNQQSAPFMGYQVTGQDAVQQQYIQPAVPLRSQLTGGQPLRPQLNQPAQEQQQPMQPLRHQLTGRPAPPPPDPYSAFQEQQPPFTSQSQTFQGQSQPQNLFQQQQQPLQNAFQPQQSSQNAFQQPNQMQAQPQKAQQYPFASQNQPQQQYQQQQQETQPKQPSLAFQNAFQSGQATGQSQQLQQQHTATDAYQPQNLFRPPSTQPAQTLTPQLTGLRPKFQPTVDLNAPFGHNSNAQSLQTQSPQRTGQTQFQANNNFAQQGLQPQRASPQVTGQFQASNFGQGANQFQRASPQVTGQFQSTPFGQSASSNQNQYQSSPQAFQSQSTGSQMPFQSAQNQSSQPSNDPFGSSFTAPLRAQLTGMMNSSQPYQRQSAAPQNAPLSARPPQTVGNQFSGLNNASQSQSQTPQMTGSAFGGQQQYQASQPLFAQNTGTRPNQLFPQNTGGQGINPTIQQPYQQQQQNNFSQQQQLQPQQQQPFGQQQPQQTGSFASQPQQQFNRPFQQQSTGYQQQQAPQQYGANPGLNPAKPFDKAGIMSLYGMQAQQPPQQQQFQPQQQQYQQLPQQQYNSNGYGQQNGYTPQQGYNGYQ